MALVLPPAAVVALVIAIALVVTVALVAAMAPVTMREPVVVRAFVVEAVVVVVVEVGQGRRICSSRFGSKAPAGLAAKKQQVWQVPSLE